MVERTPRRMAAVTQPSDAYQGVAAAWARGPAALYDMLATVALEPAAQELRGATVLDVGAGTGALCRALRNAGAIPVAVDTSADMLGLIGDAAAHSVVGDMCALPLQARSFDAAASGFAISHIDQPQDALAEMRRVVRPRGQVIAAVFGEAGARASKDVIDEVARDFGYLPPAWYVQLKSSVPASGLTCTDQRHPGSSVRRPTVPPPMLTRSTRPFSKTRSSSGLPSVLCSAVIVVGIACLL